MTFLIGLIRLCITEKDITEQDYLMAKIKRPRRIVRMIDLTPAQCAELEQYNNPGNHIMLLPRIEDRCARVLIYGPQTRDKLRKLDEEVRRALMVEAGDEQKTLDFR